MEKLMKSIPRENLEKKRKELWRDLRYHEAKIKVIKKDIEVINKQLEKTL